MATTTTTSTAPGDNRAKLYNNLQVFVHRTALYYSVAARSHTKLPFFLSFFVSFLKSSLLTRMENDRGIILAPPFLSHGLYYSDLI